MNSVAAIQPGFQNPSLDSGLMFRHILDAMSRPGSVYSPAIDLASPPGLNRMACAVALTLCDLDTAVWVFPDDNTIGIHDYIGFHTNAPATSEIKTAKFVLMSHRVTLDVLREMPLGSDEYPDRSATILMLVDKIGVGKKMTLNGPGIKTSETFCAAPVDDEFWLWRQNMESLYPLGVDIIFVSDTSLAAIPRSTHVLTT